MTTIKVPTLSVKAKDLSTHSKILLEHDSCLTYSGEHGAYWGEDHQGYTE